MNKLTKTTVCIIDTYNYGKAVVALKKTLQQIQPDRTIFLTDIDIKIDGVEVIQIPKITSKRQYSLFMIKSVWAYIETEFALFIQHDGYVLNGDLFPIELYEYDYAGALWLEQDGHANGNGGFSWRSKKLLDAIGKDDFIIATDPEDNQICRVYRNYLELTYGLKWATDDLCEMFSFELRAPIQKTFGFHNYFHHPYKEIVKIKRMDAMGDVIMVEPVLHHFHNLGYRVCLDTLPQFFGLFQQHYFEVLHPQQLDGRIPVKEIDLTMAYESMPQKNHLEVYYEISGVKDGVMRNPILNLTFDYKGKQKLFKKYVVIHSDIRGQGGRNVNGFNWDDLSVWLISHGYEVIHLGMGEHKKIKGAIEFNTATEGLLMWAIAGADLFVGIDSGLANMAVAFNVPSCIFFGSVDPKIIYPDLSNICVLENDYNCQYKKCWHSEISTVGATCKITDEKEVPCSVFDTNNVIYKISNFISK